jgi:hypothetical protein
MTLRTVAVGLGCLALLPAAAQASSKPNFPRTVTGTISGSYSAKQGETTNKASWTVKSVRFKLVHVRFLENTWTGYYDVTGGTVSYSETETGPCSYSLQQTFALKTAMPKRNPSTPFYMTRNMLGRDYYGGIVQPAKRWNVTETCSDSGGGQYTNALKLEARNLFDSGEKHFRIGQQMKGRYSYKDDYLHATKTWTWSLKGRR